MANLTSQTKSSLFKDAGHDKNEADLKCEFFSKDAGVFDETPATRWLQLARSG
jgi:hypothetical protein